jgi:hypothetical protein
MGHPELKRNAIAGPSTPRLGDAGVAQLRMTRSSGARGLCQERNSNAPMALALLFSADEMKQQDRIEDGDGGFSF